MKSKNKNIIILGGDGFCGWPTSLYLSKNGYMVTIIDSLVRRKIDNSLGISSLTPIKNIYKRICTWNKINDVPIKFIKLDLSKDNIKLTNIIKKIKPSSIVHFAEQRSAPYSMKNNELKRYTLENNLLVTTNVLNSIIESNLKIHLIHLGTMGVYGYDSGNFTLPEGYLDIKVEQDNKTINKKILFPSNPGSIYHLSKSIDQLIFQFYAKNDNISITDLHQGIVWGTQTPETKLHKDLINRFDYDGDYGTILNRFLVQATIGTDLTLYGIGKQTRAFININDTVKSIKLAITNQNFSRRVRILNQATETFRLIKLAKIISKMTKSKIVNSENPRKEKENNNLKLSNQTLLKLGLKPIKLKEGILNEILQITEKYKKNVIKKKIKPSSYWVNKK